MEIYLDNSATTKPCEEAIKACVSQMRDEYGNPSSLHRMGFLAEQSLNGAKAELAKALSCDVKEIYFTSGATESNNLAIIGAAMAKKRSGKKILISAIEHPSVKESAKFLSSQGFNVKEICPNSDGEYTPECFANEVDEDTILVSCMLVNNENGLVLPVQEIAKAVKRKNPKVIMHCDAVQGFMKLAINLKSGFSAVNLMSFSGHKIFAPKGIGALFIRKSTRILPQSYGGNQQGGIRSGTEPMPLIAAFAAAVKKNNGKLTENEIHYLQLKNHLLSRLGEIESVSVNVGKNAKTAPHILNFSTGCIRSEVMLHFLEGYEIYVSSGSACAKGKQSYVLSAFGIDRAISDTAIRVSFSLETTTQMLDIFVDKLKEGIATLAH